MPGGTNILEIYLPYTINVIYEFLSPYYLQIPLFVFVFVPLLYNVIPTLGILPFCGLGKSMLPWMFGKLANFSYYAGYIC